MSLKTLCLMSLCLLVGLYQQRVRDRETIR